MTTTTMMASWCRSPRCSAERRGFRRELDSWRHKLIHCIGFESILEGLYGPGLLRDLSLFDDCEPEEVSDWIVDENCPFCCLRRDKVKEHLTSPSDLDGAPDSTDTAEQLERETETFLHALFQRKDPPRACNPAIPLVAREIMYRMIRQFAAEYAQRRDAATVEKDGCEASPLAPPASIDTAAPATPVPSAKPSCPTSSGNTSSTTSATPSVPEHDAGSPPEPAAFPVKGTAPTPPADDSILSKLLSTQDEHAGDTLEEDNDKADEDGPLDLSLGKSTQDCKYDQAGVLDLSTKKSMPASKSPSAKASAAGIAGKVLMIKEDTSYNGGSQNSTLYLILLKLCPLHQHLLVVVLKLLAEDHRSRLKSSNSTKEKTPCMSAVSDGKVLYPCKAQFRFTENCNESLSGCTGQQLSKVSRASSNVSVLANTSDCNSKDSDKRYYTRTRREPQRRSYRSLAKSNAEALKHLSDPLQNGPAQVSCRRSCSTAPKAKQLGRAKSPSPPTLSPVDSPDELEDCDFQQKSKISFRKSRPPRLMPQDDQGFARQSGGGLHSSGFETLERSRSLAATQKINLKTVHNGDFEKGTSERCSEKDSLESAVLVDELMDRINLRLQTIETTVKIDGSNLVSKLSENSNKNNGKKLLDDITSLIESTKDSKRDYSLVDLLRKHEIHMVQTRLQRRQQNLGMLPQSVLSPTNEVSHYIQAMQIKNELADPDGKSSLTPFHVTKKPSSDTALKEDGGTYIDCSNKESKFDSLPAENTDYEPAIQRPTIQNSCEFYRSPSEDSDIIYVDNFPNEFGCSEIQFKNVSRGTARKSTRGALSSQKLYELQTICLRATADTSEGDVEPHEPQENGMHLKEDMAAPANGMGDIPTSKKENCNSQHGQKHVCMDSRVSCISETQMLLKTENESSKRVPGPRKSSRLILKERADAKTNERIPLNSRHNVNGHEKLMDENTQAVEKIASFTKRSEGSAKHQSRENIAAVNTGTVLGVSTSSGNYQLHCQQNALSGDEFELSTCSTLCSSRDCVHSECKGTFSHNQCVRERRNLAEHILAPTGNILIVKDGTDKVKNSTNSMTSHSSQRVPFRDRATSIVWKSSVAKASDNNSPTEKSPIACDQRTLRSHQCHTQSAAVDECSKEMQKELPSQTDLSSKNKMKDLKRTPGALEDAERIAIESSTVPECQPHDACTDSRTCFNFALSPTDETSPNVKCADKDESHECPHGGEGGFKDNDVHILCSHDSNGHHNHSKAEINSTCKKTVHENIFIAENVQCKVNLKPQEDLPPSAVGLNPDCSRERLQPCHSESTSRGDVQNSLGANSNNSNSSLPKSARTMESLSNNIGTSIPSTDAAKWSRSEFMKLLWQKRRNMLASRRDVHEKTKCSKWLANTPEQTSGNSNNDSFISKLRPRLFYGSSVLNMSTKTPVPESPKSTTSVISNQTQSTSKEHIPKLQVSEFSNNLAKPEVSVLDERARQNVNKNDGKMQTRSQIRAHEMPEKQLQEKIVQHRVSEKHINGTHLLSDNCTVLKNVFTQEIEMYNHATQPSAEASIFHTFVPDSSLHLYDLANIGPAFNLAGEYFVKQEMVDSINGQYEKINRGWIHVKNCELLEKGNAKPERKKDIWLTGKKKTNKTVRNRLSLIPQLFSNSCSLPKLQEWFLESTETRRLPILSKANARDPFSVLQASREKTMQMLKRKSIALTAKCDRMEKHLKKFALTASKVEEGPAKQHSKKVTHTAKLMSQTHSKQSSTATSVKEHSTNFSGKEKAQSFQNLKPKLSKDPPEKPLTTISQSTKSSSGYSPWVSQQKWLQSERISKKYTNMRGKDTWTGAQSGKLVRLPRELKALWDDVRNNIPALVDQYSGTRKSRMQSISSPTPLLSMGMNDVKLQNKSKSSRTNSGSTTKSTEPSSNDGNVKRKCSSSGDPASPRVSKCSIVANDGHVDSRTVRPSLESMPVPRERESTKVPSKSPSRLSKLREPDRKRGHDDMSHASAAKKIHFDLRKCSKRT